MKPRVYIETTVISYLTAKPSRDLIIAARQELAREVWDRLLTDCEYFVSALMVLEACKGDEVAAAQRLDAIHGLPCCTSETTRDEWPSCWLWRRRSQRSTRKTPCTLP